MILLAVKEFCLDLSTSVLIGDKYTDIQAGQNAGIQTNILFGGDVTSIKKGKSDFHFISNLKEAQLLI